MGPDDYKADLDAVNIAAIVRERSLSYTDAATIYYADLKAGKYTRADKFLEHVSYQEIERAIFEDSKITTMDELHDKNLSGYLFLISLQDHSNDLKEG